MQDWFPIVISLIAMLTSVLTGWFTLFRRGELCMTQPTIVYLGPDGSPVDESERHIKLYLRTLLYSSSRSRQTVESLYVNIQRGETKQNFSIWVYGDDKLSRGSGLSVGEEGVACNHYFLLPHDGSDFKLFSGVYTLKVYGKRVCDLKPRQLLVTELTITEQQATELKDINAGIYFDWGPDQQQYHAHVEVRKPDLPPKWLLNAMGVPPVD